VNLRNITDVQVPHRQSEMTNHSQSLDGMQTQLDDVGDPTGRMGNLTDYIGFLNARIGNVEQLLQRPVRALEGRTA
jgi:hypothetical protein